RHRPRPHHLDGRPRLPWKANQTGHRLLKHDLARHAGISERPFLRRFAEETGTTPLQWLVSTCF
ncbi:AraC family transcriptional regulator, partial [Streptomyces sp. NPDC008222]